MADEDDLDEKELKDEADDLDTDTPPEKEEKAEDRPVEETPEDEDTDKEVEQAEDTGEDQASKKTYKEELEAAEPEQKEEPEHREEKAPEEQEKDELEQNPVAANIIPEKPSNPVLSRYQNYIDEYKKLQDQQRKGDLVNGLIAAGGKIGQGIAGKYSGNFVPDQTGNQMLAKMNEAPTQRFEQGMKVQGTGMQLQSEMQANDPNSNISEAYRNYFKQRVLPKNADGSPNISMFPNINQYSASDVQNLLKTIGKPTQTKTSAISMTNKDTGEKVMAVFNPATMTFQSGDRQLDPSKWIRDYRENAITDLNTGEKKTFSGATGKLGAALTGPQPMPQAAAGAPEPELTEANLHPRQKNDLKAERNGFLKDAKVERGNLVTANKLNQLLTQGDPHDPKNMIEIEKDILALAGSPGRVPKEILDAAGGEQSWVERMKQAAQRAATGGLTDENNRFLIDTSNRMTQASQKAIDAYAEPHLNALHTSIPQASPTQLAKLLGVSQTSNPTQFQQKQDPKIVKFAKENKVDYPTAKRALITRGYQPQE